MYSNERPKKAKDNKNKTDLGFYFQQKKPIKRKRDTEDGSHLDSREEENFAKKKRGITYKELKQIKSMISKNLDELSSFIKKNKMDKFDLPENEDKILTCFLYINNNQKNIINDHNYRVAEIDFKVEVQSDSFINIKILNKEKDSKSIGIEKNARIMNFIDEKQGIIYIHFIYNATYLSEVMNEINFEFCNSKPEELKLEEQKKSSNLDENSFDSTISFDNFATIFNMDSIKNIFKYNIKMIYQIMQNIILKI